MEQLLRLPEVSARIGLRRSAIYAAVRDGLLAPPVRLGARAVAWKLRDVETFIRTRPATREVPPAPKRAEAPHAL